MNGAFEKWCHLRGECPMPASPIAIVRFVHELHPLGIDALWDAVQEVSRAHYIQGLPDPTLGGTVQDALNKHSGIKPPASWKTDMKVRFGSLPLDVQREILRREAERDREVRRVQRELADLKRADTRAA